MIQRIVNYTIVTTYCILISYLFTNLALAEEAADKTAVDTTPAASEQTPPEPQALDLEPESGAANSAPATDQQPPAAPNAKGAAQNETQPAIPAQQQTNESKSTVSAPQPDVSQANASGSNSASSSNANEAEESVNVRRYADFSRWRLHLEGARPNLQDNIDDYEDHYGKSGVQYGMRIDGVFLAWPYFGIGAVMRGTLYKDSGYAFSSETQEKDKNAPTTFNYLGFGYGLMAEVTPFMGKYLVLDGWYGGEQLQFEDIRESTASETANSQDHGDYVNKGWRTQTVYGGAVNILLNPLDETSGISSRELLGITRIYLKGYYEKYAGVKKRTVGLNFDREVYGLGFVFETRGI